VEQAAGGTLFLDEVGDLSLEAQAKLLRFLEEGEFYRVGGIRKQKLPVRIVSATNKDVMELISTGLFREDLYYRLAVVKIVVPSLNERREDILPIATHFLVEYSRKFGKPFTGISEEAGEALRTFHWKGNVRELKNIMERAVLVGKGPILTMEELGLVPGAASRPAAGGHAGSFPIPSLTPEGIDFPPLAEAFERHFFQEALRLSGGNETRAASLLGMNHHTFRYRRRRLDG
jgi:DNA-binding NtrC family response regulator